MDSPKNHTNANAIEASAKPKIARGFKGLATNLLKGKSSSSDQSILLSTINSNVVKDASLSEALDTTKRSILDGHQDHHKSLTMYAPIQNQPPLGGRGRGNVSANDGQPLHPINPQMSREEQRNAVVDNARNGESGARGGFFPNNTGINVPRRVLSTTSPRSLAGVGVQELLVRFAAAEFRPLVNDLQTIAASIAALESGAVSEIENLNTQLYNKSWEANNLRQQLNDKQALVDQHDAQVQDLSGALTRAQARNTGLNEAIKKAAELEMKETVDAERIKSVIGLLSNSGSDKDAVAAAIAALQAVIGVVPRSAEEIQPTAEDASDN